MSRNYQLDYAVASKVESFNNPRDVRALTEPIAIEDGGSADEWKVHSASGRTYDVNTRMGKCSCFDSEENNQHCKHIRAVTFHQGQRPAPIAALFLADRAREILNSENEVEMSADDIEQVAEIRVTGANGLEPRTKWVDADGNLVAESQPDKAEVEPPAAGDDIDAEREMVEQQAAGGGTERCGAETADGGACQRKGRCPYHDDETPQQADTEREIEASATADVSDALANAATATDGGAVEIETDGDALDRVFEQFGDERPIVVVVQN